MRSNFKNFILAALIRAIRTFAQAALAAIGTSAVLISDVNWVAVISTGGLAAILSILTSIITGLPEVDRLPDYKGDHEK